MDLPYLKNYSVSRGQEALFKGLNRRDVTAEGEFSDMRNMTSSCYPVLSPRSPRQPFQINDTQPAAAKYIWFGSVDDVYYWVTEESMENEDKAVLYRDGIKVEGAVMDAKDAEHVAVMGAYLLFFPAKTYYLTTTKEFGRLDYTFDQDQVSEALGEDVYFLFSQETIQKEIDQMTLAEMTQEERDNLKIPAIRLKSHTGTTDSKISQMGEYLKGFRIGDAIEISGIPEAYITAKELNCVHIIWDIVYTESGVPKEFVVSGTLKRNISAPGYSGMTIRRAVPEIEFPVEWNNRIWGCKGNEIYACKLGDPFNWQYFGGTSIDSYAASIGTANDFTGSIKYNGNLYFFKESIVYKIYGTQPSNFQIINNTIRGVQKGCDKSLCIVNDVVYYKSPEGILAYTGGTPVCISQPLGDIHDKFVYCGAFENKLYACIAPRQIYDLNNDGLVNWKDPAYLRELILKGANIDNIFDFNGDGTVNVTDVVDFKTAILEHAISMVGELYVYDTDRRLWHKEDDIMVRLFFSDRFGMHFINEETGLISTMPGDRKLTREQKQAELVDWYAVSGWINDGTYDNKYVSKLTFQVWLDEYASANIWIRYEENQRFQKLAAIRGSGRRNYTIPIVPRRGYRFQYKISGVGDCNIYSISKNVESAGEY